jgi:hypothetical protein
MLCSSKEQARHWKEAGALLLSYSSDSEILHNTRLPKWWKLQSQPREFVAQGDRVLVVGLATGRVKATNRTFEIIISSRLPFEMAK